MKWINIAKMMLLTGAAGAVLAAAGCGGDQAASSAAESGKKVVKVAHTAYYFPYDFVEANNQSDGLEVAGMKEVEKKLPQYEFQYVPTSDDDL